MENTEKKNVFARLIEKGKQAGKLTTQEIDSAILDIDFDIEELDKFYEQVGDRVPAELYEELKTLEEKLSK